MKLEMPKGLRAKQVASALGVTQEAVSRARRGQHGLLRTTLAVLFALWPSLNDEQKAVVVKWRP